MKLKTFCSVLALVWAGNLCAAGDNPEFHQNDGSTSATQAVSQEQLISKELNADELRTMSIEGIEILAPTLKELKICGEIGNNTQLFEKISQLLSGATNLQELSLDILNIWNIQLTTLPPEIWNLTNLQILNIRGTRLTTLPPEIGNLINLQHLNLSNNPSIILPSEIWNLTNLQILNIRGTRLTTLPPEIGKLTNLQELNLKGNQLATLPPEIGNLTNLQRLFLGNNKLTTLPSEIWNLTPRQVSH